jgi:hypothetical protein
MNRILCAITLAILSLVVGGSTARATGVPIDGFLPFVGFTLTSEFDNSGLVFTPSPRNQPAASAYYLGHGSPVYDVALLDTGAATSLLTSASDDAFNIDGPYPNRPAGGFSGFNTIGIGGASGVVDVPVNDPLGLYVAGLQSRLAGAGPLALDTSALSGQTNTSLATLPPESTLPNILGLSFASQYTTRIRNSLPQVFELNGETVRTPAIDFQPLGSGGLGISRKAQLFLRGESPSAPTYIFDFGAILTGDDLWNNPSAPTIVQGGHFINATAQNNGSSLSSEFFLDTGASVTVLSTFKALELGFDVTIDEPEFTISVTGSGGTIDVPGFFVDQLTITALGGNLVVNNVPVIVLDVTNVGDPGNVVDGIIGTNVFYGRDIVIDPNPSLGGGGPSPGLYFSDPVTTQFNWTSSSATETWSTAANWSAAATPGYLSVANLRHVAGSQQEARIISSDARAFEVNITGGTAGQTMTLALASGAKLTTFTGTNIEAAGQLTLENATLDTQYVYMTDGSTLAGTGSIRTGSGPVPGQVENVGGTLSPGFGTGTTAIGQLDIEGRLAQASGSTLAIDLAGTTPGISFDRVMIEGGAVLAGTLEVSLLDGFVPVVGSIFEILVASDGLGGSFDTLMLPASFTWEVDYLANSVVLEVTGASFVLGGDYNGDGVVDAADYSVWRDSLGATGLGLAADGNGDLVVDAADYQLWRSNFGQSLPTGSLAPAHASVPEPAALAMLCVAATTGLVCRRLRQTAAKN